MMITDVFFNIHVRVSCKIQRFPCEIVQSDLQLYVLIREDFLPDRIECNRAVFN